MNKITADLFRKYVAGVKTLLPVEKMKISDIKNILYSYNSLAREHETNEISLTDLRSFKKVEAYDAAQTLIKSMQESRKEAINEYYEDAIKTVTKALINPNEGKSKLENISKEDIDEEFIDKSAAIFEALAEKLNIRDDNGNLIYNFDLNSVTQDSGKARAYIFEHSKAKYSDMTSEEIAQDIIDKFGNLKETSTTQDAKDDPKPPSVKTQADVAMKRANYKL